MAAADTKVTLVRGSETLVVSVVPAPTSPIAQLTANCEHGRETDRGEFSVGRWSRAIRWRILFCEPCWEHFRDHQEVIDLRYFEDSSTESASVEAD